MYKLKKQPEILKFVIPSKNKEYKPVEQVKEETKSNKKVKVGGAYETIENKKPAEIKENVNLKKFIEINL
jgi:hypothetical protein